MFRFEKGESCFLELIQTLNGMKINAQKEGQPTIRNVAKLLMNSMYGRFGIHNSFINHAIVDDESFDRMANKYVIESFVRIGNKSLISYALGLNSEEKVELVLIR